MQEVPDDLRNAENDFMPAAVSGAMAGGSAGLIGGLIGVVVPPIGLTIAGVAATTLVGAAVGSWVTALIGSMVPDEVDRQSVVWGKSVSVRVDHGGRRRVKKK